VRTCPTWPIGTAHLSSVTYRKPCCAPLTVWTSRRRHDQPSHWSIDQIDRLFMLFICYCARVIYIYIYIYIFFVDSCSGNKQTVRYTITCVEMIAVKFNLYMYLSEADWGAGREIATPIRCQGIEYLVFGSSHRKRDVTRVQCWVCGQLHSLLSALRALVFFLNSILFLWAVRFARRRRLDSSFCYENCDCKHCLSRRFVTYRGLDEFVFVFVSAAMYCYIRSGMTPRYASTMSNVDCSWIFNLHVLLKY